MTIKVDNISFSYPGNARALNNISLEINQGERVALTGHNGSGKTTLVKHLNGLLKPDLGEVWIEEDNTRQCKTTRLVKKVALLFQNPDDQLCKQTVAEEVAFGPKNLGFSASQRNYLVEEALALFDLLEFKTSNPHDLGYSQRKRTAMASIVAMDTPTLVFDEPTAGLDYLEITQLLRAFETLQQQNKTIIVISHDIDFLAENMDRAISLARGQKIFDGTVRDLFQDESLLLQCGLIAPQMVQLSRSCNLPATALSPEEFISLLE